MQFKDANGLEWDVNLTVLVCERMLEDDGTDIHALLEDNCKGFIELDQPRHAGKLLRLIYAIIKPQAESRGVDLTAFMNAMDGEAMESAWGVFRSAFVNFTRERGIRNALRRLLDKQDELQANKRAAMDRATTQVLKIAEKLAKEAEAELDLDKIENAMREEMGKAAAT